MKKVSNFIKIKFIALLALVQLFCENAFGEYHNKVLEGQQRVPGLLLFAAFTGCVDLSDDVNDGTNCPTNTGGIEGKYRIIPYGAITDYGTMDGTSLTWDTDFTMSDPADTWFTHDTDEDKARIVWEPTDNNSIRTTVTLFYDGYSPQRRYFFEQAVVTKQKFDIAVTDNDGNVFVISKVKLKGSFDSGTSGGGEVKGFAVTGEVTGKAPIHYTGAFV